MATTIEELAAKVAGLEQQMAAITVPPTEYYTSIFSGEEIDAAIKKVNDGIVGGVSSFNGRSGVVVPQAGDYNATQIPVSGEPEAETVAAALNNKPNRNLLDNWYFMNPVNQRGVSGTISEAGYFIDRWKLVSGSVTLTSTGITINGTISQVLENAAGTNVTASALTTTGIVSVSYDNSSKTFTITGTGQTFVATKLELGSQQTLAHQDEDGNWVLNEIPDYGEELAKCQRYYRRYGYGLTAIVQSANILVFCIPFDLPMRITPATGLLRSNLTMYGTIAYQYSITNVELIGCNTGGEIIAFGSFTGNGPASAGVVLRIDSPIDDIFELFADL